jgi:hypothetical protein
MSESEHVYEIDPKGKYVVQFDYNLSHDELEYIRNAWREFISSPDQGLLVLFGGVKIIKVDTGEKPE